MIIRTLLVLYHRVTHVMDQKHPAFYLGFWLPSTQRLYLTWPPLPPLPHPPPRHQDNVVCLSPRLAQSLGNMGQVCVCIRVTSAIHLIDPRTLQSEYRAGPLLLGSL